MGSKSDLPVMQDAINILNEFQIDCEVNIVSAHRTPEKMFKYASEASNNGIKVIIAGAGGAAHLPGMVASITTLPLSGGTSFLLDLSTKSSTIFVSGSGNPHKNLVNLLDDGKSCLTLGSFR